MIVSIINTTFILITTYYLFPTEERRLQHGVAALPFFCEIVTEPAALLILRFPRPKIQAL